jgi:uncharacterized protein YjbI with pentapeptide repeats
VGANLEGAQLLSVRLDDADLSGASFTDALIDGGQWLRAGGAEAPSTAPTSREYSSTPDAEI